MKVTLLLIVMVIGGRASAVTYYVDYTNGKDSNSGTSKDSAWKHAPGMNHVSGLAASTKIHPGDRIIFRGCQHWLNESFPWYPELQGTSANPVYVGVDQSWWDDTVAGCSTGWNRPVLDLQQIQVGGNGSSNYQVILLSALNYVTLDNFEYINVSCSPVKVGTTSSSANLLDWGVNTMHGVHVTNFYIHAWYQRFVSIGTGNSTAGSATITNFVPYSWSPFSPSSSWAGGNNYQALILGGSPSMGITQSPNGNVVTAISGSNPYSITGTNAAKSTVKGAFVIAGVDGCQINGGASGAGYPISGQLTNSFENNIIDGSDTNIVAVNPYADCGLSEGNNNWCIASGTAVWRVPSIVRNNLIRFVSNGLVGDFTEWSGNTLEYFRLSPNISAHTNAIESTEDVPYRSSPVATLAYNNLFRHLNNPNPNLIGPGGSGNAKYSIGLGNIQADMVAGEISFQFNNVMFDTLQNAVFENVVAKNGNGSRAVVFNNTADCGPSWSLTFGCVNPFDRSADVYVNNLFITSSLTPNQACRSYGGSSKCVTEKYLSPESAAKKGYKATETYAYSPSSDRSPTVGKGTSIASLCSVISKITAAAGAACLRDTTYGVGYNTTTHTVVVPNRAATARPDTPDVGAYQLLGSTGTTQPGNPHP